MRLVTLKKCLVTIKVKSSHFKNRQICKLLTRVEHFLIKTDRNMGSFPQKKKLYKSGHLYKGRKGRVEIFCTDSVRF